MCHHYRAPLPLPGPELQGHLPPLPRGDTSPPPLFRAPQSSHSSSPNILNIFIHQVEIGALFGGACKWRHFTKLNKESATQPLYWLSPHVPRKHTMYLCGSPGHLLWCSTTPMLETLQYRMWHTADTLMFLGHAAQPSRENSNLFQFLWSCTWCPRWAQCPRASHEHVSPYMHFFLPRPPMHLSPCWSLGSTVCSYQCTSISQGLSL